MLGDGLSAQDGMALLGQNWWPGSVVLHLPGGGSERANTPRFLEAVRPQVVVASIPAGDRGGLPHTAVQERLDAIGSPRLYRTDRHGTIEIVTDGTELEIHTAR